MGTVNAITQAIERKPVKGGKYNKIYVMRHYFVMYYKSCVHGVIVCAKMLFLSESVRDVIDIKLSKAFNSPTNILGTLHQCVLSLYYTYL